MSDMNAVPRTILHFPLLGMAPTKKILYFCAPINLQLNTTIPYPSAVNNSGDS